MSTNPILILQMQRMGDLILTYPLVGWLHSIYPEQEIWIVGERYFFEGLLSISPKATYFNYSDFKTLAQKKYSLIINLSHRKEAAKLASSLSTERLIGAHYQDNNLKINGNWQLYRNSITHNNKFNLFHWADLNALDVIPTSSILRTSWPPVKTNTENAAKKIGLFVGASEAEKRPDAQFWAELAGALLASGLQPVFLGGEQDKPIAAEAYKILNAPALNLCGHFSIHELCLFFQNLDLLVVPDTGPMHIATWIGLPCLNLSMGNVNPWETGAFAPQHYILQSKEPCVGCWSCTREQFYCKKSFKGTKVAKLIKALLKKTPCRQELESTLSDNNLFCSQRDNNGLYELLPLNANFDKESTLKLAQSKFWKHFFYNYLTASNRAYPLNLDPLYQSTDKAEIFKYLQTLLLNLATSFKTGSHNSKFNQVDFWKEAPEILRPLSSYLQLYVQNDSLSQSSLKSGMELLEIFKDLVENS